MTDNRARAHEYLLASAAVKRLAASECDADIAGAAELIFESLRDSGKLLLCGNGGSAADCQHIAAEFVNLLNIRTPRPALAAISLATDSSALTAIANDFGFEQVFARQVEAIGRSGDVLVGISTSGTSPSVLHALATARRLGLHTIGLTGRSGGAMAQACDVLIRVPSDSTQHIQEVHIATGHIISELVEAELSGLTVSVAIASLPDQAG